MRSASNPDIESGHAKLSLEDQINQVKNELTVLLKKAEAKHSEQLKQQISQVEQRYNILKGMIRIRKVCVI